MHILCSSQISHICNESLCVPVCILRGGLRKLLHLSEDAEIIIVYCIPHFAPVRSQDVLVLLHIKMLWS